MKTEMPPSAPPSDLETIAAPPSKLDDFCRICLLRKEPLLPLTSEFNGTMIPEMLWKVSGTLLNVLEQLPRVICDRCLTKLDLAYSIAHEFRKQEELLRSFCWKGALVEQLDGFQRTEDAAKEPYSEDVLKKLAPPARRSASGSITVRDEKEMLQKIGELPPEEDTIEEATELMVEQLDDIIEIERFGEEAQSEGDQFEMIVEENSIDSGEAPNDPKDVISEYEHGEKAVNDSKDVDSEYEHGEEPEECVAFVKKELEEDEEQPKDSVDPGVLSVLVTKVEEEWIEDYDKPWEKSDHEAEDFEEPAPAAGEETEESQDPIWFDEGEREKAVDDELPKPKRRKGPAKVATKKRAIKSVTNAEGQTTTTMNGMKNAFLILAVIAGVAWAVPAAPSRRAAAEAPKPEPAAGVPAKVEEAPKPAAANGTTPAPPAPNKPAGRPTASGKQPVEEKVELASFELPVSNESEIVQTDEVSGFGGNWQSAQSDSSAKSNQSSGQVQGNVPSPGFFDQKPASGSFEQNPASGSFEQNPAPGSFEQNPAPGSYEQNQGSSWFEAQPKNAGAGPAQEWVDARDVKGAEPNAPNVAGQGRQSPSAGNDREKMIDDMIGKLQKLKSSP